VKRRPCSSSADIRPAPLQALAGFVLRERGLDDDLALGEEVLDPGLVDGAKSTEELSSSAGSAPRPPSRRRLREAGRGGLVAVEDADDAVEADLLEDVPAERRRPRDHELARFASGPCSP
jgi:hypothetical protein